MAADTSTSTGSFSFSVDRWLKAVGLSIYTTAFITSGHVSYGSCISLSEEDVRAVGAKDDTHRMGVDEQSKISQEVFCGGRSEAIISEYNTYCTVTVAVTIVRISVDPSLGCCNLIGHRPPDFWQ